MPKAVKKSTPKQSFLMSQRAHTIARAITWTGVAIILACCIALITIRVKAAERDASVTRLASLITLAMRGLKADAPVDPQTGTVYFPEARLSLPADKDTLPIYTYNYDSSSDELSVSTRGLTEGMAGRLFSASDTDELMSRVPHNQACSRGVRLTYTDKPSEAESLTRKATVTLSNGKTLHIFTESACPELTPVANALTSIRSY